MHEDGVYSMVVEGLEDRLVGLAAVIRDEYGPAIGAPGRVNLVSQLKRRCSVIADGMGWPANGAQRLCDGRGQSFIDQKRDQGRSGAQRPEEGARFSRVAFRSSRSKRTAMAAAEVGTPSQSAACSTLNLRATSATACVGTRLPLMTGSPNWM